MSFTPRPAKEIIAEYREVIQGYVMQKRVAMTDGHNPERALKEAATLRETAAKLLAQADRVEQRTINWKDDIENADLRIEELNQKIAALEQQDKIEAMKKLMVEMGLGEAITTQ